MNGSGRIQIQAICSQFHTNLWGRTELGSNPHSGLMLFSALNEKAMDMEYWMVKNAPLLPSNPNMTWLPERG